ncbi:MAG: PmoA family protein [Isosphaerales bacterium]
MCEFKRPKGAVFIGLWFCVALAFQPARAESWRLLVRGGDVDLGETPVVAEVEAGLAVGFYFAVSTSPNENVPAQVFQEGDRRFLATILPNVAKGRATGYILTKRSLREPDLSRGIAFRSRGRDLLVELDQRLLTAYHVDAGNKPFFFPLIGPTGAPYTRAYPMETVAGEDHDHPHQRSCWFTHGNVNGVDFWGEAKNSGTIRETDRSIVVEGPVMGRLATKDDWQGPDARRVCRDERVATFYRTKNARIFDFEIKLHATDGPVTFHDTKEGMFGLRVASSMDVTRRKGGKITNAEGLTDEKAWGQASPWVDYIGPVNDKTVGIAVFNHPGSFRFPTTWHVRPYGLFAANPFGWHDFGKSEKGDYTIPAGQTIAFRYRVILHEGEMETAALHRLFDGYARPPTLELEKN